MNESQNKGEKLDHRQPQVSCHLKYSTKTCFFDTKNPKKKGCYILPAAVFLTFFEREKVV